MTETKPFVNYILIKKIKNKLRTKTKQNKVNNVMVTGHIHKHITDVIKLGTIISEIFVSKY